MLIRDNYELYVYLLKVELFTYDIWYTFYDVYFIRYIFLLCIHCVYRLYILYIVYKQLLYYCVLYIISLYIPLWFIFIILVDERLNFGKKGSAISYLPKIFPDSFYEEEALKLLKEKA